MRRLLLLILAGCSCLGAEETAAGLAARIKDAGLDAAHCYRVRELNFNKEDLRVYLTDGYLIFGKPVDGRRLSAIFSADVPGGDAEVMLLPPTRGERAALVRFAGAPNLNEHFTTAVFLFTDGTGEELLERIRSAEMRTAPEAALLMVPAWDPVLRNLTESYEIRLVRDLFPPAEPAHGFFFGAVRGKTLGTFDFMHDPRSRDQILAGSVGTRDEKRYFDIWTNFPSRSARNGKYRVPGPALTTKAVTIRAELDEALHLNVVTRLRAQANVSGIRTIEFELARRMNVTGVKVNGSPAELFMRESMRSNIARGENGSFLVIAPEPLEAGRTYDIEIRHDGDVVASAGHGVYFVGSRGTWYPNHDYGFAEYEMSFRYPKAHGLVATGEVVEDRIDGEWRVTTRRASGPVRMAGFNLGDYAKATASRSGYTVEVYANRRAEPSLQSATREMVVMPPGPPVRPGVRRAPEIMSVPVSSRPPNSMGRAQELATEVAGALEFMTAHFGALPLKTLTVSPIPGAFGQGFPGLLYLSTIAFLNEADRPKTVSGSVQQEFFSEILHAHETAHQWWGNVVVAAGYQDDWLMEALSNYSALMLLEKRKGRRTMDATLETYRERLLAKTEDGNTIESSGPIVAGSRLTTSQTPGAWKVITYEKGSWIIHMLRGRLGDARFLNMLGDLVTKYKYKAVTTQEFQRHAASFLPPGSPDPKLETFFEQWVYGTGIPALKVTSRVQGTPPRITVRGTVTQTGATEDFSTFVPVEVQLPGRKTVLEWVRTGSEPAQFSIDLKQRPLKVELDPGRTVLAVRP